MADIVLRNIEADLKEKLRLRAASNQRSMNAELREIADIRALSAGRQQTPSEDLLREGRDHLRRDAE